MFILGSKSPRRQKLLRATGIRFTVRTIDVDETYPASLAPEEVPIYLAKLKASAFTDLKSDDILLTADTIVIADGQILGKPTDKDDAKRMLKLLQGRTHKVVSGICLKTPDKNITFSDTTLVHFMPLTDKEIRHYVNCFKPYDKAGAYGIQEWIGQIAIDRIEGSYNNVVGLPTHILYKALKSLDSLK